MAGASRGGSIKMTESFTFCSNCSYPLTGVIGGQCPECGAAFDPQALPRGRVEGKQVLRCVMVAAVVLGALGLGIVWSAIVISEILAALVALFVALPLFAVFARYAWRLSGDLAIARAARATAKGEQIDMGSFQLVCCTGIVFGQIALGVVFGFAGCFGCLMVLMAAE